MPAKELVFKMALDQETADMLEALKDRLELSKAQIVRECIQARAAMQLRGEPKCANGRACFVAHLHLIQTTHATPVHNIDPDTTARLVAPPIARTLAQ